MIEIFAVLDSNRLYRELDRKWEWKTEIPLPEDPEPFPEIELPKFPAVRMFAKVWEDGYVEINFGIGVEDVETPAGLEHGLEGISVPIPFTHRRGEVYHPAPESFLQVE